MNGLHRNIGQPGPNLNLVFFAKPGHVNISGLDLKCFQVRSPEGIHDIFGQLRLRLIVHIVGIE